MSLLHLLATLAVAGVLWAGAALFQTTYAGRIYPHVTIGQMPVGGMTRAEALAALRDAETARLNAPIDVQGAGQHWQVTPAQFGTTYDITAAVDRALALAHTGPFMTGGWNEATTIWSGASGLMPERIMAALPPPQNSEGLRQRLDQPSEVPDSQDSA